QSKVSGYTSDNTAEAVEESMMARSLFSVVYAYFRPALTAIISMIFYRNIKGLRHLLSNPYSRMLCFVMSFCVLMNLIGHVPFVNRFYRIEFYLLTSLFIILYQS